MTRWGLKFYIPFGGVIYWLQLVPPSAFGVTSDPTLAMSFDDQASAEAFRGNSPYWIAAQLPA